MSITAKEFRLAIGTFATGVTVITVDLDGAVHGMTANAVTSVSLDPLLLLVCVDHKARTRAHLFRKRRFGLNVLSESQRAISEYYARSDRDQTAHKVDARFRRTLHGTPILENAMSYLECRVHSVHEAGDHSIFIAAVDDVVIRDGRPLLVFRGAYYKMGGETHSCEPQVSIISYPGLCPA